MIVSPYLYALLAYRGAGCKRSALAVAGNLTGLYLAAICIFPRRDRTRMLLRRGLIP